MKLFDLYETRPSYIQEKPSTGVSYHNERKIPAMMTAAGELFSKKLSDVDVQQKLTQEFGVLAFEARHVINMWKELNGVKEGKDKPKQNNPVAKHSRNMPGAGSHKSPKDYDRKDAKKDIKKELEEGEERSDIRDLMIPKIKDYLERKGPGSYISLEDLESDLYDYASNLDHDDLDSPEELRNFMHNPGEEASSAVTELLSGMYHSEFDDYISSDSDYVDNRNMGHPDGYSSSEEDEPDRIREESDAMIGKPDNFYDAEERQEAYNDLQDALQGNYMDDYIKDGSCPACAGSGYMDGEDEVYNDETEEYEEGSECDGFGNYGCDEGEMTYGSDGPSWVEIIKHDKRQADRKDQLANRPSDEELIPKVANMMKNMDDPRMAVRQVRIDYGYGPAKASDIVGKAFELLKQDEGLQFDEGTRCWKGYEKKGTKKMFGKTVPNCVKKEAIDKDTPCPACGDPKCDHKEDHINEGSLDGYYLAHRAKKLWLGDNPGKTERDYWQVGVKVQDEYTEKAGGIKGEYQGKGVSNWTVEEQVPYLQRPNSGYSKAIADYLRLNPGKSEDDFKELLPNQQEKYLNKYVEGKSPHKKGTAKYKKHMAAMHAEDVGADSSEADVSKMLAKALGDPNKWTEMSAPELYAELESRDTEFADAIKQVAKIVYGVKLEESK
jgi:hypothetical protein